MRAVQGWMGGLALAAMVSLAQAQVGSSPHPDVYLITIDTLRADHVHCYGDETIQTPALDSLARDGMRFTQAFTPSPITNTAHTSILTGLLPSVHGVTDFGIPLDKAFPTWAELLQHNGYATAAFIGSVVLDARTLAPGLDRGFDAYDNFPAKAPPGQHWGYVERRGIEVARRAETWMSGHSRKPRFVWVHLYDPHDPYQPPAPYSQIYKGRLYDGEIAYADSALGDLLSYLKREKRFENALVIVVGDHGEGLGEHGEQTHGIFLYDATTHVPLIIKLPGGTAKAQVFAAQVETTDLLPTVLDVLGIPPPAALAHRSLLSRQNGSVVFEETDYPLRFGWAPLRAVRSGGFQFIEAPQPELYDLTHDPFELKNQYEPWSATVQQLRADIASSGMRPPRVSTGAAGHQTLSELRALGYLGPGDEHTYTNVPELSSLPDPKDRIEEQNLLHSAMMLAEEGRSESARLLLQKLLLRNADSAAALRQLGELELRAGEYHAAADHLDRARKAHPNDALAALYEGEALDKLGDRAGAEDKLEAALVLDSANQAAAFALAQDYFRDRRFADVVELLQPLAKSGSANSATRKLLAEAKAALKP